MSRTDNTDPRIRREWPYPNSRGHAGNFKGWLQKIKKGDRRKVRTALIAMTSYRKKANTTLAYLDALRDFPDGEATVAQMAERLQLPRREVFDKLTLMEEEGFIRGEAGVYRII